MPLVIKEKKQNKKKKSSPKGGGLLMTPGQKKMLDKQTAPSPRPSPTGRGKPMEAKSGGVMRKSGGKSVGKILDDKASSAIRKGGGSISEKEMLRIMRDAGLESGLFEKPAKRKAGGGPLKQVPEGSKGKGLSKLPTPVRNKMGFMKNGGKVMKMRGGGMASRGISFRMR